MYYSIDPNNPSFGLQSPVNPKVRTPRSGTFEQNVNINPALVEAATSAAAAQASPSDFLQNYRRLREARKAGVDPNAIRLLGVEAASTLAGAGAKAGQTASNAASSAATLASGAKANAAGAARGAAGLIKGIPTGRVVGGTALLAGVPSLLQGDVAGAAGNTAGALVGGALGAPFGPIGALAGSTIGAMVGGGIVGGTKAALEKTPQAISIPTPFGDLPLNASAQQLKYMQQLGELGETQQRNALQTRVSATIDLNKKLLEEDFVARQREFPLMQAEQNADLARSQALINTQNNAYMQQMVLGTASNLMLDAQRERGALMRQAIATNPYVTALAAPGVSIG